jgi:hypothetical protein
MASVDQIPAWRVGGSDALSAAPGAGCAPELRQGAGIRQAIHAFSRVEGGQLLQSELVARPIGGAINAPAVASLITTLLMH